MQTRNFNSGCWRIPPDIRFDTVLHTRHGALYCSVFKRRIQEEEITNPFVSVGREHGGGKKGAETKK
jgi:hypothetical protein